MDRLVHLNQLLANLEAQLAGLEKALTLAPLEDKTRLRLLIEEMQREIRPYAEEKARIEAGRQSVQSKDRPASMQVGLGQFHSPQDPVTPRRSPPQKSVPPADRSPKHSPIKPKQDRPVPYRPLMVLALGYVPTGLIVGLAAGHVVVGAVALAIALILASALALDWARDWVRSLAAALAIAWMIAWTVAGSLAWSWALTLDWVWAGALIFSWTVAGAFLVVLAFAEFETETETIATLLITLLSSVVIGGLTSYSPSLPKSLDLNIWQGLRAGLVAALQWWMIMGGWFASRTQLKQQFSRVQLFGILGVASSLGLVVGWGVGLLF